eukprot:4246585-Pyramimonas_sp.AAC.1
MSLSESDGEELELESSSLFPSFSSGSSDASGFSGILASGLDLFARPTVRPWVQDSSFCPLCPRSPVVVRQDVVMLLIRLP